MDPQETLKLHSIHRPMGEGMAKVRLQDPVTGKFHWVERAAMQPDGTKPAGAAVSEPPEDESAGPMQSSPAPSAPRETQRHGPAQRARNPMDEFDTFFDGDGTETVDREDL